MQLTMTGEYAIRTMVHLANLPPGTIAQIAEISRKWDIPETFLRKIVAKLSRCGLVESHRGIGGGLSLSRSAEEITLLQIVEEMEGPMALNRCLVDPHVCTRQHTCVVHSVWAEAQGILRDFLATRTLADLLPASTPPAVLSVPDNT
ncbi:MAG TPA: Rrf2 family transcriptional regulator [Bacteroidota bacterium]